MVPLPKMCFFQCAAPVSNKCQFLPHRSTRLCFFAGTQLNLERSKSRMGTFMEGGPKAEANPEEGYDSCVKWCRRQREKNNNCKTNLSHSILLWVLFRTSADMPDVLSRRNPKPSPSDQDLPWVCFESCLCWPHAIAPTNKTIKIVGGAHWRSLLEGKQIKFRFPTCVAAHLMYATMFSAVDEDKIVVVFMTAGDHCAPFGLDCPHKAASWDKLNSYIHM